jgi:hypothetical protein
MRHFVQRTQGYDTKYVTIASITTRIGAQSKGRLFHPYWKTGQKADARDLSALNEGLVLMLDADVNL